MKWNTKTKRPSTVQKSIDLGTWSPLAPWVNAANRGDQLSRTKWGAAQAYIVIGYVEKCVELIASGINTLPYSIKRFERGMTGANDKWEGTEVARSDDPIPQHPLFQLFHAYEDHQHMSLLFRVAASLTLFDELYIELVRKRDDYPVSKYNPLLALDWLNPLGVSLNASNGKVNQYFYSPFDTGSPETYKPFEIAYKHGYNPQDDLRGYPDVLAVLESLEIDFAIQTSVVSHFQNGIQGMGVVSSKGGSFSNLQATREGLEDAKKRSRGPENVGGLIFWPGDVEVTKLDYPDYSAITSYSQKTGERILNQFGVPETMLGNSDIAGYKQGDETTYRFYTSNIIPRADDIIAFFNRRIIPLLPPEYHLDRLVVDRSEFDRVSENDLREAEIAGRNLQNTIITINEARKRQKLEPFEEERGNLLMVQPGMVFVSPEDLKSGFVAGGTPEEAAVVAQTSDVEGGDLPDLPPEGNDPPPFSPTEPESLKAKAQDKSAYVYIDLAERDELLAIQRKIKGIIGESADIEWQEPDTFHVTLVYAPDISDRELDARTINSIDEFKLDDNPLEIKEVGIFDTDNGQALHLVVNNSVALDRLQSQIFDKFKGMELSEHSNPNDYHPHITMAYIPNEVTIPDIEIEPFVLGIDRVVYGREYYDEFHVVGQKSNLVCVKAVMARSQSTVDNWDWSVEKAQKELDAWYTFIKRRGANGLKSLPKFEPNYTRGDIADTVIESFKGYNKTESGLTVKSIFGMVKDWVAIKSVQATRIDFEDDFEDTLQVHIDGKTTRRQASSTLRSIIRKANNKVYRDGLTDGGALGEEPTDAEQVEINQFISEQSQFVTSLLGTVKSEKLTSSQGKGAQWYNKSVKPMYDAGFASAGGNKMSEWVLGKTEIHCKSCSGYNGQRHRFKHWVKIGAMPQSDTLACHGDNCDCNLVPVKAKARGKLKLITKSIMELMKELIAGGTK